MENQVDKELESLKQEFLISGDMPSSLQMKAIIDSTRPLVDPVLEKVRAAMEQVQNIGKVLNYQYQSFIKDDEVNYLHAKEGYKIHLAEGMGRKQLQITRDRDGFYLYLNYEDSTECRYGGAVTNGSVNDCVEAAACLSHRWSK